MLRSDKQKVIDSIRERFDRMSALVITNYEGLDVAGLTQLRREFRRVGAEYTVAKNTFVEKAMEGKPYAEVLKPHLKGMTGLAWTYDDPTTPMKVLREFRQKTEKPVVKCGVLGSRFLSATDVEKTADLPSLPRARAMFLGLLQAPAQKLLALLQTPARQMLNVVVAHKDALEKG